jgi:serine/threonine-protein kinase HipA
MIGTIEQATVYYGPKEAGVLRHTSDGFEFCYHSAYRSDPHAKPITRRLPLNRSRFAFKSLLPWFQDVLPEGWVINALGQTRQLNEMEQFALLLHMGTDTLGPVSLHPVN